MKRMTLHQFCLPARAKIMPRAGPYLQASPANDPTELRTQILPGVSVSGDEVFRRIRILGQSERILQIRPELREDRDNATLFVFAMLCLR